VKMLITLDFPPEHGGIQRYLYGIVKFTYSKEDCVLIGCSVKNILTFKELPPCIHTFSTPLSGWNKKISCIPIFICFLKTTLRGKKYEIECGNVYAAIVPWLASFFLKKINYSVYTYGTELTGLAKPSVHNFIIKKILCKADKIYALGGYTAGLLKTTGIKKKTVVFPPRIELPKYTGNNPDMSILHLLCVGRLVPHKGHSVLIEAVSMLPDNIFWKCVIVGDGPQLYILNALSAKKGINDRVIIKTNVSDDELWKEYEKASIFILPSIIDKGTEGFGIVLLEAMAHSVPVIASNTGGIAEVLDNGSCGVLVEPGNAAAISEAIKKLYGDINLRSALSQKAYNRVRTFYAW